MVDDFLDVVICGVSAFYDLNLSPSSVCGVRDEALLQVCGVAIGSDEVWSVVFRFCGVGVVYNLVWFEGGRWGHVCRPEV